MTQFTDEQLLRENVVALLLQKSGDYASAKQIIKDAEEVVQYILNGMAAEEKPEVKTSLKISDIPTMPPVGPGMWDSPMWDGSRIGTGTPVPPYTVTCDALRACDGVNAALTPHSNTTARGVGQDYA